jgi:hypothetical protein
MLLHIYDRLEVTGVLTAVFDPKAADGSHHPASRPPSR